jgi:peptidoglycan/xylan/chitin deacetylase (PgdA/CDA1 family)
MKYLKDNGFNAITISEAYDAIYNGKSVPPKPVVITFDDGYEDNYTNAYPILMKYGLKGTMFVITDVIGKGGCLSISQIQEMYDNGMDIESHTVNHEQLNLLSYDKQLKTLKTSKEYLESILNKKVISIAYPFGKYNSDTIRAVKEAGYLMAFTTQYGFSKKSNGILTLARVRISASDTTYSFASKIGK